MRQFLQPFFLALCLSVFMLSLPAQQPLQLRDTTIAPQTFAMIVGVSKYKYIRSLNYAHKDAELFRDYLKSPGGGSVKDENIFCLLNEEALNSVFWSKGFQWLKAKKLRKGDRLFIYLAGHGDAIDEDQFFFLTYDCNPAGDKNNYLAGGAIQLFNLKKKIAAETTKGVEVFFIMDACRTNELPGGADGLNFLNTAITEKKAGEVIMLSTAAGEYSLEDASIGNGHGLFTYYLVDGLSGLADDNEPDQKITFSEIQNYISSNVPLTAQQRFNRKQDPYFCCNEHGEKVIGHVDTAYLSNWLQRKKQQGYRGGNSSSAPVNYRHLPFTADTLLLETYRRFNAAVKDKKLTGSSSAEEYYTQLNKKFPGNPYTLDAQSSLTVGYINAAQEKVNDYLSCMATPSAKEKQLSFELGNNLQKAIELVKEEEPEFAASLVGRMYFLKAGGDFGNNGKNGSKELAYHHAYAALAAEPGAAYIQNKLALLHLADNRLDSALHYANKTTRIATKWLCGLYTLSLIQKELGQKPDFPLDSLPKRKAGVPKKIQWGGLTGGGISELIITTAPPPANDSLPWAVGAARKFKYDIGFTAQVNFSNYFSIRPSVIASLENSELIYDTRPASGGQEDQETVAIKRTMLSIPVPVVIRLSDKKVAPYITAGPVLNVLLQQNEAGREKLSLKKVDFMGDIGLGLDIATPGNRIVISPELKYSRGLSNVSGTRNDYGLSILNMKRQNFTFAIYIRAK